MTAEIAIYNKSAVALAADSAVTISSSDNAQKIYNGAEKLFALSKRHPVGIMVYSAGSLCGVPWELIIKEFRKSLGAEPYNFIEDYAKAFWEFIKVHPSLIPEDFKHSALKSFYWEFFYKEIINPMESTKVKVFIEESGRKPSNEETYNLLVEQCSELSNILREQYPFYDGFDDGDIAEALEYAKDFAAQLVSDWVPEGEDELVIKRITASLADTFSVSACKVYGNNTGLVFAGYGHEEYFPTILAFNLHGFVNNKLRLKVNLSKSKKGGVSGLCAYAQEDEVDTFMQGVSRSLRDELRRLDYLGTQALLDEVSGVIDRLSDDGEAKNAEKERLKQFSEQAHLRKNDELQKYITNCSIDKVVGMIEFLPKQELAEMAESLVSLTAFKRKVSNESETVGGPIDVAVISKGDGFIWVKRKHYFDKNLNHHYFQK